MAMARPVGRPSSPPFALITTVVLLVIATAAAVALYVQWTKAQQETADARDALRRAQTDPNVGLNALKGAMRNLSDAVTPSGSVGQIDKNAAEKTVQEIKDELAGIAQSPDRPIVDAEGKQHREFSYAGFAAKDAVKQLNNNRQQLYERMLGAEATVAQKQDELNKQRDTLLAIQADMDKVKQDDAKARTDMLAKFEADLAKAKGEVDRLNTANGDLSKQLVDAKIARQTEVNQLNAVISRLKNEMKELQNKFKGTDPVLMDQVVYGPAKLPDGTILQVFPEQSMVYLRLNRPDQAKLGMRYIVHSKAKPLPNSGEGKSTIEITSLEGGTIQGKIIRKVEGDPVIAGDLLLNIVTGPRAFNFVVFGEFDLNNDRMLDGKAKEQIEALITRWGGHIQQEIDITTNFVVLGEQVRMPDAKPGDGADAMVVAEYQRRVAENKKWTTIHDTAQSYSVPILNGSTLLHWIGYYNYDTAPGWDKRVRPPEDYFHGS